MIRQTELFASCVKPKLAAGKTAYIWVDALRYEMARELTQTLTQDYNLEIRGAVATVPTITEIGMAVFLPGASDPGFLTKILMTSQKPYEAYV